MSTIKRYQHSVKILCLCGLLWANMLPGQGNPMLRRAAIRAVIVGISDYQHITDLDYAHRDAEALAEYLRSTAGGKVPPENIRLLLNEGATQMQFAMALDWLQEESREGDRAFIFFSGHGDVEKTTARQRGFLLTYDAPTTTYMAGGAFPLLFLQDIVTTLSTEQGVEVILIADACRAGKLAGDAIGGNHVTAEKLAEAFANEIKILSCQKDELSQEGPQWGGGRGAFSYHLIEGLIGLADQSQDEEVNLREIRNHLESQVGLATSGKQLPLVVGDLNHRLARVDAVGMALLQQKIQEETMQGSVAMKSRGLSELDSDTAIWRLYLHFQEALHQKHLLYPSEGAAYTIYEKIKEEAIIQPYRSDMKRNLAIALHDEAQQAINNYLTDTPQELRWRRQYNERYEHYPEFLGKAAELLGPDHFMYEDLKTRQLYFEGLRLRLKGEQDKNQSYFKEALKKQEWVVRRDTSAAYAYNEIGLLYRRLQQKEQATPYFYLANRYSPAWVLPMTDLITNYTELEQLDSALTVGKRALLLDSTFALTHHNLGFLYEQSAQWPQAIASYQKAIQFGPDYADSYYNLGLAYFQQQQLEQTEYYFLQYAEKSMLKEAAIYSDLGYIADLQDKDQAAMSYFEQALAIDPEYAGTYLNMGEFHLRHARLEAAEKAYVAYLERRPNRALGHYMLAAVWARQGKTAQALNRLDIAVSKGFQDVKQLEADVNFVSLRETARFVQLVKQLKE